MAKRGARIAASLLDALALLLLLAATVAAIVLYIQQPDWYYTAVPLAFIGAAIFSAALFFLARTFKLIPTRIGWLWLLGAVIVGLLVAYSTVGPIEGTGETVEIEAVED